MHKIFVIEIKDKILRTWRRVLSWFKDDIFRRLFMNAGQLLTANVIATGLGFITMILVAKALGPEKYGILALVLAYQITIGRLVSFQAWEAIIKFGSEALKTNNREDMRKLLKFGFCLDISGAVVGTIVAILVSGQLILLLGWDVSVHSMIVLYSWLILFSLNGTPIGVLRLFDRFDLLSYTSVLGAIIKLIGVGLCILTGQNLIGFVWIYLISGVTMQLYLLFASLRVLRSQKFGNFVYSSLQGIRQSFPGIWDYAWVTNLNSTIRMLSREIDLIIIAVFTSPATVGIFKIAKQFGQMFAMVFDPLYQSIYPELARLWAGYERKSFLSLIKRSTLFVGVAGMIGWLGFLLVGKWLIVLTLGAVYADAYIISAVYIFALFIAVLTFSFQPSMLAMGMPRNSFMALIVSTGAYFGVLFLLIKTFGILGAALAYVAFYLIWGAIMLCFLRPRLITLSKVLRTYR